VYQDKSDERRVGVRYTPLKVDRESVVEGQVVAARMAYAVGAREVDVLHTGVSRFAKSEKLDEEGNKAAFELWLQELRRGGLGADGENGLMGTAHQMGTVRMGASPDRGAIDGKGKLWGARNVWVADASTFPSASGVNPMVSNMGIARWIAEGVVRDWEEGGKV
jgi:choline dehydrogenase-like flavoprotein